jgi:hypothetical protein
MLAVKTIALGAVGIVALVGGTAPASAQYYPGTPYGYGHGYGHANPGQVIGQVIAQVLNPYGQWGHQRGVNPQVAVSQCSRAVQHRLGTQHHAGYGYQQHNPYGYGHAYNQARVLGITHVQQRSATTMTVRGVATSGMFGAQYGGGQWGGGQWGGYGQVQPHADLSFRCDVDFRGQIRHISIGRR